MLTLKAWNRDHIGPQMDHFGPSFWAPTSVEGGDIRTLQTAAGNALSSDGKSVLCNRTVQIYRAARVVTMSDVPAREGRAQDGDRHQPGPPERRDRAGLEPQSPADQRCIRPLRLESIRILPPHYMTLTDQQEARAVAMLVDLLMPLCKAWYPCDPEER